MSAEATLVAQAHAQRVGRRVGALALLVVSVLGLSLGCFVWDPHEHGIARMLTLSTLGLLVAAGLFASTLGDPKRHPVLTVVRDRAQSVVWFFMVQPRRRP